MQQKISKRLLALLKKKNPKIFGTRVGDTRNISKRLMSGAKVPTYAKKGGHVKKKTKKK